MIVSPRTGPAPTIERTAAEYIERGWSVIPIEPGGKRPPVVERTPDGRERRYGWERHQTERAGAGEVEKWLRRWPSMNLGVVTGVISGVAVLDLDGPEGREALRHTGIVAPGTRIAATPKGWHAYYAVAEPSVRCAVGIVPRVDVRGERGYVVVPPSVRPEGAYRWLNELPFAPAPNWLAETKQLPKRGSATTATPLRGKREAERWVHETLVNGAPDGQRNQTATRICGYLHSKGLPDDVIEALLLPWADRCTPPFERTELRQVIGHVARYALVGANDGGVLIL